MIPPASATPSSWRAVGIRASAVHAPGDASGTAGDGRVVSMHAAVTSIAAATSAPVMATIVLRRGERGPPGSTARSPIARRSMSEEHLEAAPEPRSRVECQKLVARHPARLVVLLRQHERAAGHAAGVGDADGLVTRRAAVEVERVEGRADLDLEA